ncbi:hypothetical protein RD792_012275 [Penstemon davidsonii]|uniref:Protein kinase domain-containing protein n=1 Tax=Penstemon davidsonii TaxID=160366 RepID=A0ABR0CWE5_9LAMI|nr:hypothetical protein RD792_012275 [Penstemon davidsonii]
MSLILPYLFFTTLFITQLIPTTYTLPEQRQDDKCGDFQIPFPFYLNNVNNSSSISSFFSLSCVNSSTLFLNIDSESYKVLHFFPDGVLVDFPNTSLCRQYNDLKSFPFSGNQYLGVSSENVVDLYDCEDSSLCKPDCEKTFLMPSCEGQSGTYSSCCYPLSDRSVWHVNDSFSGFSKFGCRGFSSWVVLPGSGNGKRGVKLEWAVPRNLSAGTCVINADVINATSVASGIRCQCKDGFIGDGFAVGVGCLKSCIKDGKEVHGKDCYPNKHGIKKTTILAGVITSAFTAVSLMAIFCLLKRRIIRADKFVSEQDNCSGSILSQKTRRSRLFTYQELEEATKGFDNGKKIAETTMYVGILLEGSHVAVQKVQCENERDVIRILFRVEALFVVFHKSLARIIGWSINTGYTPLVVYEYPENGTLEEHLSRARYQQIPLDWYKRLNIVSDTANVLAFLHHENLPPIFHNDIKSSCIFLETDFSVKLAGFEMNNEESCGKNDVCSFGVVLLEIITGNTKLDFSKSALQKIKNGKLEEIVDPSLYYHEQPVFRKEQIEIIADLATRCLLYGGDGKLGMVDVARELLHITKIVLMGVVEGCLRWKKRFRTRVFFR